MVKVGLVIGPSTPSERQAPRTSVVFPVPSSPETVTTSPSLRSAARRAPTASVSSGEAESISMPWRLEEAELDGGLSGEHRHGLRLQDVAGAPHQLRNASEVLLQDLEHPRGVERGGRVVQRIQQDAIAADRRLLLDSVHARDP